MRRKARRHWEGARSCNFSLIQKRAPPRWRRNPTRAAVGNGDGGGATATTSSRRAPGLASGAADGIRDNCASAGVRGRWSQVWLRAPSSEHIAHKIRILSVLLLIAFGTTARVVVFSNACAASKTLSFTSSTAAEQPILELLQLLARCSCRFGVTCAAADAATATALRTRRGGGGSRSEGALAHRAAAPARVYVTRSCGLVGIRLCEGRQHKRVRRSGRQWGRRRWRRQRRLQGQDRASKRGPGRSRSRAGLVGRIAVQPRREPRVQTLGA